MSVEWSKDTQPSEKVAPYRAHLLAYRDCTISHRSAMLFTILNSHKLCIVNGGIECFRVGGKLWNEEEKNGTQPKSNNFNQTIPQQSEQNKWCCLFVLTLKLWTIETSKRKMEFVGHRCRWAHSLNAALCSLASPWQCIHFNIYILLNIFIGCSVAALSLIKNFVFSSISCAHVPLFVFRSADYSWTFAGLSTTEWIDMEHSTWCLADDTYICRFSPPNAISTWSTKLAAGP